MLKPSNLRPEMLTLAFACALLFAACGAPGENSQSNSRSNSQSSPQSSPQSNTSPAGAPGPAAGQPGGAATTKLNLNTASENAFLTTIPGMGDRMVHEFLEYRPYRSIQQFRREMGKYVSAEQIAEYEKYVFVPISVNEADAATLQQIPGLDAGEAGALIAARPYASADAFTSKLAQYVSEAELGVAKNYLSN